jgi:hypothetical protein
VLVSPRVLMYRWRPCRVVQAVTHAGTEVAIEAFRRPAADAELEILSVERKAAAGAAAGAGAGAASTACARTTSTSGGCCGGGDKSAASGGCCSGGDKSASGACGKAKCCWTECCNCACSKPFVIGAVVVAAAAVGFVLWKRAK